MESLPVKNTKYPKDLAEIVFSEIKQQNIDIPSLEVLVALFETMYFSSIKTEESESIVFNISYLDPSNPDSNPPGTIFEDRWEVVELSKSIQFDVYNVIKLATASDSDQRTSSLATYHDKEGNVFIWGLIDQGNRYHDYVNFEMEEEPERPGIFQASLEGPGNIAVYIQTKKIAELRVNRIVRKTIDVFDNSPIKEALKVKKKDYLKLVKKKILFTAHDGLSDLEKILNRYWFSSICRLILRIKNYGHGGAMLFSDFRQDSWLNVKYKLKYNRLKTALINNAVQIINSEYIESKIIGYLENNEDIPIDLYSKQKELEYRLKDIRSEIDGALWFASLLSRIDGLVLMNKNFDIRGFGVEITKKKDPESIFTCSEGMPSDSNLTKANCNYYGTRHRSMMRYCWHYPDTVGFVISQDGDVRTMTKYQGKLIIWENIKLQAYTLVERRLRIRPTDIIARSVIKTKGTR
jgi:hypothetical protein